jgi:hypothetical protein
MQENNNLSKTNKTATEFINKNQAEQRDPHPEKKLYQPIVPLERHLCLLDLKYFLGRLGLVSWQDQNPYPDLPQ